MTNISVGDIDKVLVIGHTGRPTYKLKAINFIVDGDRTVQITDVDIDDTLACLGYEGTPPDSDALIEKFANQILARIREEVGDSKPTPKDGKGKKGLAWKRCAAIVEGGCVISMRVKTKLQMAMPDIQIIDLPGEVGTTKH